MRVTVVLDHRFYQGSDGTVWTETSLPYSFWTRYLAAFDSVRVIGRMQRVNQPDPIWKRADGQGVRIEGVASYTGPIQYLARAGTIRRQLDRLITASDAYILRVPSHIGTLAAYILSSHGHPYGLEVVGDPHDVFASGVVSHPFRSIFRQWFTYQLKKQCAKAGAVAYVTARTLQRRYPPADRAYTTHYSSAELPVEAYAEAPKTLFSASGHNLIAVGSLAQLYKGPDVLIGAIESLVGQGLDVRMTWVGGGRYQSKMMALAEALGLRDRVQFVGNIPAGDSVRDALDKSDLFVLPSRTEGLPRAVIEAMARGLPCVGTRVGGIPELLDDSWLVPPNDPNALARVIHALLSNPALMSELSARNLRVAHEYSEDALRERRNGFYLSVKDLSARRARMG